MKLRPFELALVIIFIVLGLVALALLAAYDAPERVPEGGVAVTGTVQIWGTMPGDAFAEQLAAFKDSYESYAGVTYQYVEPDRFESALINALADDIGPDLVLISHEQLVDVRRRLWPESYESFPLVDVRQRYVDGAEIFALQDGLYARPMAVDPLVLYWNRDILATAGYLESPRTWEQLIQTQFGDLIDRSFDRTINRSVVAMGEYDNVRNAFGIVSMLLQQSGSVGVVEEADQYEIRLNQSQSGGFNPVQAATDFYTRFSQPSNTLYSWNRSFTEDRQQFIAEDLAFYFGYASEGPVIERLNPNLNFDVAEVPQQQRATVRRTYGQFYGLGLVRTTDNLAGAQAVQALFTRGDVADAIAINSGLAPATRATINAGSNTRYGRIAYQSAAIAYGWLSPSRQNVDIIFNTMMQDVNENRSTVDESVSDALTRLKLEY